MKNPVIVEFAFDDWKKDGVSVYQTEEGVELSMNDFHSGTVFQGILMLAEEHQDALINALHKGFTPTFTVYDTAALFEEDEV